MPCAVIHATRVDLDVPLEAWPKPVCLPMLRTPSLIEKRHDTYEGSSV